MSQIFDALQKSESERSGTESALPQGAELLRRAEKHAASTWEAKAPAADHRTVGIANGSHVLAGESGQIDSTDGDVIVLTEDERASVLSSFSSVPIVLSSQSRLVCLTDKEDPTAEAVRLLAVRLRDIRRVRPIKKVLLTSSIPKEGKSTIAANLACALAHASEEKVLLIEGDVRLPASLQMFGIERLPGLCDCLQEGRDLLADIFHADGAGLWILPSGNAPGNPLELLQSSRLVTLMEQLAAIFDWIIIDSPPILPLADTSIWMRLADGILIVTRQGTTEKQQLRRSLEAIDSQKLLGAILNGTQASAYSGYYYTSSRRQ